MLAGASVPELQKVAMRATAQVSSSSAAERGHKLMDNVLTSNRNRMKWENVEAIIYIQQNAKQLEKREAIDYEAQFVAWTDGTEENTSWQDAWQEQREGVAGPESD
eukprot:183389-Prorocentrum_minimum.AAC.1